MAFQISDSFGDIDFVHLLLHPGSLYNTPFLMFYRFKAPHPPKRRKTIDILGPHSRFLPSPNEWC